MAARLAVLSVALLIAGCTQKPAPPINPKMFSGTNAFAHVEKVVGFGPRWSGSEALDQTAKYFVEDLKSKEQVDVVKAFVLLDMIGDARLNVSMPANSSGELTRQVFEAARSLGYREYFGYSTKDTIDDHVPFVVAGVPSVDI